MSMRSIVCLVAVIGTAVACTAQSPSPHQLTVAEAVAFGLKNSPTLRGSQAEIAAARAEAGLARSRTSPQLSANGFASQGNMQNILQSVMGVEPRALALSPDRGFVDANLMLMAPLYTGGFLSGLVAAAGARVQAAVDEAAGMRAETALRIRETYAKALYGADLVKAHQARIVAAEAMLSNAKAQLEAGKGIEASVRRAEAELAEAQKDFTMAENDRRKMLLELLAEMGASMDSTPNLTDRFSFDPPSRSLQESIAAANKRRGELLAARQRVRAANSQVSSAEGALRPQVYGFAMGDVFAPRDEMGRSSGYTFGIAASLPIFDGGMRRSEISAARSMREKAQAEADRLKLLVEKEVRQTWLDIETAEQNYRTAQAAVVAAQSAYDVMVIRVETGKSILVEQLDALAALTRARANLAQALYAHQIALARLSRAIGEDEFETKGANLR